MARSQVIPGSDLDWRLEDLLPRVPEGLHAQAREVRPRRLARMLAVLDQRMGSVAVVLEAVRRRHNVSAVLRTADALGLHEVHLVTGGFRPSVGAARGSERWLDLHLHPEVNGCLAALQARGFRVYAADVEGAAVTPEEVPVDRPVALLLGSELSGVSPEARAAVDGVVTLPMRGFAESLNVSVAAALILRAMADRRRAVAGADLPAPVRHATLAEWLDREVAWSSAGRVRTGQA